MLGNAGGKGPPRPAVPTWPDEEPDYDAFRSPGRSFSYRRSQGNWMKLKPWMPRASVAIEKGRQSRLFLVVTRLIGPAYARFILRLDRISIEGRETLLAEYRRASSDDSRFVLAYRHPGDADPHLVFHVLTNLIKDEAPAMAEDGRPGAWYPAGSEVMLWASPLVNWALRNAGIVPVKHGETDRTAIDYLVQGVAGRRRPMAIAPEGQATFHCDRVAELDPGAVRIALMASERLAASGSRTTVRIIPVAIHYAYWRTTSPARLGRFVSRLETRVGLSVGAERRRTPEARADREKGSIATIADLAGRLLAIWERLVEAAEAGYARSWGVRPAPAGSDLRLRTLTLLDQSIARLEALYAVTPVVSLKARILNIRALALRRVFYAREELAAQSPLEGDMAERGAAEAFFLDQIHLVAAIAQYLDPAYIGEEVAADLHFDRLVETAQNLHDLANRLGGLGLRHRSRYFRKDAVISVGSPIEVGRLDGEGRREAVGRLQRELGEGFGRLIRRD